MRKVCLSGLISNSITVMKQDARATEKESKDKRANDIFYYACFNWVTHVQRLEDAGVIANHLTALLKRFLRSMDQSSLVYQWWFEMVESYTNCFLWPRNCYDLLLYEPYQHLKQFSRISLAIVRFGFHKTILDWWTAGFADVNRKNSMANHY